MVQNLKKSVSRLEKKMLFLKTAETLAFGTLVVKVYRLFFAGFKILGNNDQTLGLTIFGDCDFKFFNVSN